MKKVIVTLLSFLIFFITNAQVVNFLSLGAATSERDAEGNLTQVKHWKIQQTCISINLTQKKIRFFSKGIFDRDTFSLKKEITILSEITSPEHGNDELTKIFSGIDEKGRKCLVRLKRNTEEYKLMDGRLQVEYINHAEIYRLRKQIPNPFYSMKVD